MESRWVVAKCARAVRNWFSCAWRWSTCACESCVDSTANDRLDCSWRSKAARPPRRCIWEINGGTYLHNADHHDASSVTSRQVQLLFSSFSSAAALVQFLQGSMLLCSTLGGLCLLPPPSAALPMLKLSTFRNYPHRFSPIRIRSSCDKPGTLVQALGHA